MRFPLARRLFIYSMTLGFLASCGHAQDGATLKHQFGRTSVVRSHPVIACKDGNSHQDIISYVKSLLRHIAAANPGTFKGDLAIGKVCVQVVDDEKISASMDPASGLMRVYTGLFLPRHGFDSDAAIAGVLSHELAHFTMNHGDARPTALDLPADYDDGAYKAKLAEYKAIESKASSMMSETIHDVALAYGPRLLDALPPVFDEIRQLGGTDRQRRDNQWTADLFKEFKIEIQLMKAKGDKAGVERMLSGYMFTHIKYALDYRAKLSAATRDANEPWATMLKATGEKDAGIARAEAYGAEKEKLVPELKRLRAPAFQWEEQQADEVGFEFYIRAGFEPRIYPEVFNQLAHFVEGAGECSKEVSVNSVPPRIHPDREPRGSHPDGCWRYWNARYSEPEHHDAEYSPLMPVHPVVDLPALAGQRAAIERKVSSVRN
ncbi:hypothetical protein EBZ80_10240 [bacterium]|nr:hypothetical protein [bacterium]